MAEVTNPLLTFRVKLPRRKHLRCVVWESVPALRANTPEEPSKDYDAIYVPTSVGNCIGTIHLAKTDIGNGTRAHEIAHAVADFTFKVVDELRAATTESVTNEIDEALRKAGLIY